MTELTDTQLMILSRASQRDDRTVELPASLKGGAAQKVLAKLLERGLLAELLASGTMPPWRRDDEDRPLALVVTDTGLAAIGVGPETGGEEEAFHPDQESTGGTGGKVEEPPAILPASKTLGGVLGGPKTSKRDLLLAMLGRDEGATLDDMVAATRWLPHTTRAALTGLRKMGHVLQKSRRETDGKTVFRIASSEGADRSAGAEKVGTVDVGVGSEAAVV